MSLLNKQDMFSRFPPVLTSLQPPHSSAHRLKSCTLIPEHKSINPGSFNCLFFFFNVKTCVVCFPFRQFWRLSCSPCPKRSSRCRRSASKTAARRTSTTSLPSARACLPSDGSPWWGRGLKQLTGEETFYQCGFCVTVNDCVCVCALFVCCVCGWINGSIMAGNKPLFDSVIAVWWATVSWLTHGRQQQSRTVTV